MWYAACYVFGRLLFMHGSNRSHPRPPAWPRFAFAGGVAALLMLWAGCSVSDKNYKVLSVFFDGVPNPNAPLASAEESAGGKKGSGPRPVMLSQHKPVKDQQCTACHADPGQVAISALDSNLCMKCHEKVLAEYPAMHGPVVGRACLWCHEAHESQYPSLLRTTAATLCFQCHERELLSKTEGHTANAICVDCHGGHGGARPPFMRAETAKWKASTQPSGAPTTAPSPNL
jgi:predicted CXXCH cytochrome family protein